MEGYLKVLVMQELRKKECSGYELMREMSKLTGSRPSPGTMYPMLSSLLEKGLVTVTVKNSKKIYCLSGKGRSFLETLVTERTEILKRTVNMFKDICSPAELKKMRGPLSMTSGKRLIASQDFDVVHELRSAVITFTESSQYARQRETFRKILQQAAKDIRQLENP